MQTWTFIFEHAKGEFIRAEYCCASPADATETAYGVARKHGIRVRLIFCGTLRLLSDVFTPDAG